VGGFLRYTFDFTEGYSQSDDYTPLDSEVPSGRSQMYNQNEEMSSEKKVRGFREETNDGVDQNLFKPQPTKPPKKPKKRINDADLQRQLDETEFKVELKGKKKKKRSY
jgi:hypothetical protein